MLPAVWIWLISKLKIRNLSSLAGVLEKIRNPSSLGFKIARFNMPYRYLEDIATSDAAFEAWGTTLEEVFVAAADATMNVMVEPLSSIADLQRRPITVADNDLDMLLFALLQELIFLKMLNNFYCACVRCG